MTRVHTSGGVTTQTLTYATDSNRLATHDGQTVTLDAAGNTTADPAEALSFTYDDHNRMVEAYVGAVLNASYVYNGAGQRVKKVEATGAQRTIVYHYGLDGQMLGETIYSSSAAKIGERDYLWLDSLPLAQSEQTFSGVTVTSSQFVYLHADQLNTPRLATNGAGTVVWRWDSDAFGVGSANTDPDSDSNLVNTRLRFPGQYLDEETGLSYNYFRDYDPALGRYPQSDPIGLDGGLNPFVYADGNPLRFADPTGLAPGDWFGTREAALADRADYIVTHDRSLGARLFGPIMLTIGPYEVDGCWSWDRMPVNAGDPPLLGGPGRLPIRASVLVRWAEKMGWMRTQTLAGPIKYVDANGVVRATIKRGSARTPGSEMPHVELRNAAGQRIDPAGNPVTQRTLGNHTPVNYDLD